MLTLSGVRLSAVCACLPAQSVANGERIAKATGIMSRRIAAPDETALDLCVRAAERALADTGTDAAELGAIVMVSFTQHCRMPAGAVQAQARLACPRTVVAFDVSLACSGWGYGLYLAGMLARQTGRKALLLDGDVQSAFVDPQDANVAPLLGDAGTAVIVEPGGGEWRFDFRADGAKGAALKLERGGTIEMDGFGVFRFVATDVVAAVKEFMSEADTVGRGWRNHTFVPHQPNVYMVRQLAKSIGFDEARTAVSCDRFGNLASASIPVSIAANGIRGPVLFAGFGGGLSISVGALEIDSGCALSAVGC